MISAAIYIFSAVVMFMIAVRSYINYRRSAQNFIAKGFMGLGLTVCIANVFLATDVILAMQGLIRYSVIADTIATVFLYLSMFSMIWMACRLLERPKLAYFLWAIAAIVGSYVSFSVLLQKQTTFVDKSGIVTYYDSGLSTMVFGLSILAIYTWVFVVFIRAGMKNPHIRVKLYTLGTGLMMATWSAALLGVIPRSFYAYVFGYTILFVGYALQFIGVLINSRNE